MGFWDWLFKVLDWLGLRHKKGKLLLLGLDSAGKTTLLQMLKTGQFQQFDQTRSYHVEELKIEGINFSAFDLGGHEVARQSWSEFFVNANAIVFMVDSADTERFPLARQELENLLQDEALRNIPVLVLGNKIDLPGAVSVEMLQSALGIPNMTPLEQTSVPAGTRALRIFMCSIKKQTGYAQGFKWLANFIP